MPKWDCGTCTAHDKQVRGCEATPAIPITLDGEDLKRCPRRPTLDNPAFYYHCFKVYSWFGRDYLPEQGTYLDQPAAFVQMVEIIEQAIADAKALNEKADKARAPAKLPTIVK